MLSYGALVSIILILALSDGYILNKHRKNKLNGLHKNVETLRAESTLVLSHVLFRHGNRTPELSELYPKDPWLNYTYFPLQHGQLTNAGKVREYSIGTQLRDRYDTFLGPLYIPDLIDSRSTDRNRTKMSLLLVLASLFPPKCSEVWNPALNWQPIPYNYVPEKDDTVLYGISCPTYKIQYEEVQHSPELIAEYNEYADNFTYFSENSGLNVTRYQDIYDVYFGLSTEEEYGLELPEWTKKVWPDFVNEIAFKQYEVYTKTTTLKKMAAGYLIQKIIVDTEKLINKENNDTRLYLYSAHENNIGQLFATLDLFEYPHIPTYGSFVLFEVHNINNTYGFKIYYQNYNGTATPKLLKLPACDEFCPLDTFKTLVAEIIPEDGLCGN
ncbi:venom acid phosphatase Acph-1-like [Anthonomus grandis grandis]|uniref:venom acid phosphatase Acph-1-like n=1 Tax=Anthonomus grandis grandis TaxID=2921223 RepID=UPI0021652050|nr:venom acid phosphatase Acph-1-like [Anthonomus grandis grandis]XP_050295642.1 venom acid phosphatase Acph-1-like [Anthonomus grandis grandis]